MMNLPIPGLVAPRLQAAIEQWADDKRGVAAVEFALIATPFFFLIFGLLEVCVLFIMSSVLEHGVNEAARGIRTGQLQENGFGQVAFKNAVCAELFDLLDCDAKLRFDVKTFDSFSDTQNPDVLDGSGNLDDSDFDFDMGDANDIVVVRAFYEWQLITPILSAPLSNMSSDRRLLQATVAFRNEPFGD
ncbi:MAG: TadE/TadG family type IV pilus assembly protein [Pseudomonadota bacterium]